MLLLAAATGASAGILPTGGVGGGAGPPAEQIARGRQIAEQSCALCHATGVEHLPLPALEDAGPDFRLMARKPLSPEALAAKSGAGHDVVAGRAGTGLPADMADDVAAYILSLREN